MVVVRALFLVLSKENKTLICGMVFARSGSVCWKALPVELVMVGK